MSPRILIVAVVCLLGGLLLGRMGPQADMRKAGERISALQKELSSRTRPGAGAALTGVKSMFNVSNRERAERTGAPGHQQVEAAPSTNGIAESTNAAPVLHTQKWERASVSNQIDKAKKAWVLRSEIARTNFIARTKLSPDQARDFELLVEAMNLRLGATVDKWASQIRAHHDVSSENGMRMMNELSDAMVLTYDEFDRKLPSGWRENAGRRFELINFVDPEVLTPLEDLDEVINNDNRTRGDGAAQDEFDD